MVGHRRKKQHVIQNQAPKIQPHDGVAGVQNEGEPARRSD